MSERVLGRARAGDENAFRELIDPYRAELQLHCYRILGSLQDAEDVVQESLLAAWRGLRGFEGRASLRAWLYRIATNRCLNVLRNRGRSPKEVPAMAEPPEPTRRIEPTWLEPYPDVLLEGLADTAPGPEARYETREAVGLAFVTALQHLPPRQRAALVLRDVLGFRAAEVAEMLESSEASVKAALQRARATVDQRLPARREQARLPHSAREHELVGLFTDAVERGDIEVALALPDVPWSCGRNSTSGSEVLGMVRRVVLVFVCLASAATGAAGFSAVGAVGGGQPAGAADTTITVAAAEYSFELSAQSAPAGTIHFVVKNNGTIEHDFAIAGKKTPTLEPGQSATLTVDLNPGSYPYACTIGEHASFGMQGTFAVTGASKTSTTARAVTVNVTMKEWKFVLTRKRVPHGAVMFKLRNLGKLPHNFKIAGHKSALVKPGKTGSLRVTLKKGKYRYICTVRGHAAAGMKGTLVAT